MSISYLVLLHLAGILGGLTLKYFHIPAGALIGALVAVMGLNALCSVTITYPINLKIGIQIISGMVIGTRFTRADGKTLKTMMQPIIFLVLMLLSINFAFAMIMSASTDLAFMTSFFACAPGGVSDLALVAADFGAEVEQVAFLQLFRLVTVIIIFPPFIRRLLSIKETKSKSIENKTPGNGGTSGTHLFSVLIAGIGGLLFLFFHIPAGAILGAIFTIALLNLATDKASYPRFLKSAVQILAGCYIGSRVTFQTFTEGKVLLFPAVILLVELFVMVFLTASVLHTFCKMDWATALFSSTPGGISEMGLISEELGLETPKIVLMHTVRILAVLGILPSLAHLMT